MAYIYFTIYNEILLFGDIFLNQTCVICVVVPMSKAEDRFLKDKPVKTLVAMSDKSKVWYARLLAKETDTTYAHMVKILDDFAGLGLVIFEKEGRVKIVKLTEEGEELAHEFSSLLRRLARLGPSN